MIEFVVYGKPRPGGSKKGWYNAATGRVQVSDASKHQKPWQGTVAGAAAEAMEGRELLEGPLALELLFVLIRPKTHFGTGRNADVVKPSSPLFPIVAPDALKLARVVEDGMQGQVYRDDAQIVHEVIDKTYGSPERVEVRVYPWNGEASPFRMPELEEMERGIDPFGVEKLC